ncbi:Mitochondrial amidoxime reducing component 2 [Desmophyllum pertusum]|uniref:Mitochondrial amidoxime reducing component 2 n=1 Tax=Desmophyllum pertusum TaxID=174260 RepID=A0A9W9YSR5_9CNID|nr:Mitochondrial amidoxime reducing component 2 [Desmophyllum pertusum]
MGRCPLTTVNPATGEKEGNEPLVTLRRIRLPADRDPRQGQSPLFGVHVAPEVGRCGGCKARRSGDDFLPVPGVGASRRGTKGEGIGPNAWNSEML